MNGCNNIDNGAAYDLISDEWQKTRNSTDINRCIADFVELLVPNGNVLDVGCGTGYPIAKYLVSRGFFVTGIDISQKMIDKASKLQLKNALFLKKDILHYSTDRLYDGVIAFDSIWHIEKNKQPDVYSKIASLMKRGAYFIFTHGNRNSETVGTMFGQNFYYGALNVNEVLTLFSKVGLKTVSLTEHYKEKTTGERDLLVVARKI